MSKSKYNELKHEFKKYDVVGLVETFANKENSFELEGYVCFAKVRKRHVLAKRNSGGCLMFIKNNLTPYVSKLSSSSSDIIWLKLEVPQLNLAQQPETLILGCVYVSPITSHRVIPNSTFEILKEEIVAFQARFPWCKFLIAGDLNSRTGQLADTPYPINSISESLFLNNDEIDLFGSNSDVPVRSNSDKHVNNYGTLLIDLCMECDLVICNGRSGKDFEHGFFTCFCPNGASVVDYLLTSSAIFNRIADFEVLPVTLYSIHAQLQFNLKIHLPRCLESAINGSTIQVAPFQGLHPRIKYVVPFDELNTFSERFRAEFNEGSRVTYQNQHPEEMLNFLYNTVYNTAENYRQTVKISTKNKILEADTRTQTPFFDLECLLKKRKIEKIQQDIRMLNIQNNVVNLYDGQISELVKELHEAKKAYKQTLKIKEEEYHKKESEMLVKATETDKGFWEYYKKKCPKTFNSSNTVSPDAWVEHTNNLYSPVNCDPINLGDPVTRNYESLDSPFTVQELSTEMQKIKESKASGPDGLGGRILKCCFQSISVFLLTLFNAMFLLSFYPIQWTNSIVFMLFKKGDDTNPNNYRSISLLNVLSKLFTGLLHNRLMLWCENEKVISDYQFGFRSNHSTTDSIFIHKTLIDAQLAKKRRKLYTCYIDFTKAFDTVVWEILWLKLNKIGISENCKLLKMLKSIYANVTSQIITPFGLTLPTPLFKGLRQGCILSPLLFILFINDIKDYLGSVEGHEMFLFNTSISHLLFADDLVIFSQTPIGLQRCLNALEKYCTKFHLNINLTKTCILVFRRGGKPAKSEKWFIKNNPISVVSEFKYLGIIFTPSGSWTTAQRDLANRARKATFCIKKFVAKTGIRQPYILFKIFDSCILPILNYGCEIWGFHEARDAEKVYHDFCKFVAGLPTTTPNLAARGEFGRKRLISYRYCRIVKYWCKLLSENCNPILKIAYREQLKLDAAGYNVWASDLRTLLCSLGFSEIWYNQSVANQNKFLKDFKDRVSCLEFNMFEMQKYKFPRLFLFSQIKSLNISVHWANSHPFYLVNTFCKFICSAHNLAIESGRKQHTPRHMRICMFCDKNEVEDEFHFAMVCPLYHELRTRYIPDQFRVNPNWNSFVSFLINPNYLTPILYFLHKAFQKRERTLEAILFN